MNRVLLLLFIFALMIAASAADGKYINERYELQKIDDNTYVFYAPRDASGVVQSNCLVVIGNDAVLVVDTGQFPSLAKKMVVDIKKLTPKPVRYIVTTHWHMDHWWGNQEFVAAWPGVTIIAHEFTRTTAREGGEKYLRGGAQIKVNADQAKQLRDFVAKGKTSSGKDLSDYQKQYLTFSADTLDHIQKDLQDTINIPPTVGYEKELTIDLGKREVKVMWLGRANTAGDSVVWLPDIKLLATGDTVVHPAPFAFGSYLSEWPATLQKMIDMKATTIVPGHGPVMHDNSYLELVRDLIAATYSRTKALADKGLSFEEVQKQINLDDFKAKFVPNNDPGLEREWRGGYLPGALDRAYQEATGKMKSELED
jgi:glyoxylase-like metal-dependent hydrolase (beta-lactamase superfamily II)